MHSHPRPPGPATPPPPPATDRWAPIFLSFEAALDDAARELDAAPSVLALPRLYLDGEAGDVRARDLRAGRGGPRVNLTPRVKGLVRERLPGWTFRRAEGDDIVFERRLGPTLDARIAVRKLHLFGLGKCFTLQLGFDLPETPFAGTATEASLFALARRSWSPPAFAWATPGELEEALSSCGEVLSRLVPVYERHLAARLATVPVEIPEDLERRGPLSAREALAVARPILDRIAPGAGLTALWHAGPRLGGHLDRSEIPGGRLAPFARWGFVAESRPRLLGALVTVPSVGAIRAETRRLDPRVSGWKEAALPEDFADSPEIAALAETEAARQVPGAAFTLWGAGIQRLAPRDGSFGWSAFGTCLPPGAARPTRVTLFRGLHGEP